MSETPAAAVSAPAGAPSTGAPPAAQQATQAPDASTNPQTTAPPPPTAGAATEARAADPAAALAAALAGATATATGAANADGELPAKNYVRVAKNKASSKFAYVDLAKYLLHESEHPVELTAMGEAIPILVDVALILFGQKLVQYAAVGTDVARERRNNVKTEHMRIRVVKAPGFDAIFSLQMQDRRRAEAAAAGASGEDDAVPASTRVRQSMSSARAPGSGGGVDDDDEDDENGDDGSEAVGDADVARRA
jgi:hypothetical protein